MTTAETNVVQKVINSNLKPYIVPIPPQEVASQESLLYVRRYDTICFVLNLSPLTDACGVAQVSCVF